MTSSSSQNSRISKWFYLVLAAIIMLLGAVIGVLIYLQRAPGIVWAFHSSPTEQRTGHGWEQLVDFTPSPGSPRDPRYQLRNAKLDPGSMHGRRFKVELEGEHEATVDWVHDYEVVQLDSANQAMAASPSGAEFRVLWFSCGNMLPDHRPPDELREFTGFPFYDRTGKLLPEARKPDLPDNYNKDYGSNSYLPQVSLRVCVEGLHLDRANWTYEGIFDRDTHVSLSGSRGKREWEPDLYVIPTRFRALHALRPRYVVDVFDRPNDGWTMPKGEDAQLQTPFFRLQQVAEVEKTWRRGGASHNHFEADLHFDRHAKNHRKHAHPVWRIEPAAMGDRIIISAVNADGNAEEMDIDNYGPLVVGTWPFPGDEVDHLRVQYRQRAIRLFIDLPALPTVLEENRNLEDLFDARIPAIVVESPRGWYSAIAEFTQLSERGQVTPPSTGPNYPIRFEDITVRELARQYQEAYPDLKFRVLKEEHGLEIVE